MRKILLRNAASEILNREHGIFLLADKRKKDPAAFRFILQRTWKRFFIRRDEISREESSLEENFYPQG